MGKLFENKVIVILSPQPWDHIFISKHHYAKVLSLTNTVYFVSPPRHELNLHDSIRSINSGLSELTYSILIPEWIKFKAPWLFKAIVKRRLTSVIEKYAKHVDSCFDFGCYQLFDSIGFLPARYKIFFPVDDFPHLTGDLRGCDIAFTVSTQILKKFSNGTCHFINHGLSGDFAKVAEQEFLKTESWQSKDKIKAGYAGNIFLRFIDFEIFEEVIRSNPQIEFHFFGNYEPDLQNKSHRQWDLFLRSVSNVIFHGLIGTRELVAAYKAMDLFILCYKPDLKNYHGENSHKIIEYLSTGKVIVSSYISLYENTYLFEMDAPGNAGFLNVFNRVVNDLHSYNQLEKMQMRRTFAMDNSYVKQLERIENVINE